MIAGIRVLKIKRLVLEAKIQPGTGIRVLNKKLLFFQHNPLKIDTFYNYVTQQI